MSVEFRESSCACDQCVKMCRTFPCRPTPDEVMRMPREIQARLMIQPDGATLHEVPHLQAGTKGHEGQCAPDFEPCFGRVSKPRVCTFLTKQGKCELHGQHKPFEGRVADHRNSDREATAALEHLGKEWSTPKGKRVLRLWKKRHLEAK